MMERKTYAGHGKPDQFMFAGTATAGPVLKAHKAKVVKVNGGDTVIWNTERDAPTGFTITPNTKFWAEAVPMGEPTSADVTKGLRAQLDEAKELAEGFEAREAALLERVKELEARVPVPVEGQVVTLDTEMVSLPAEALDKLLEDLETAGRDAATRMERIRRNAKASYGDRLQLKFLEGTAKTAAYVLREFEKFDN
jgi:hypothetical protein